MGEREEVPVTEQWHGESCTIIECGGLVGVRLLPGGEFGIAVVDLARALLAERARANRAEALAKAEARAHDALRAVYERGDELATDLEWQAVEDAEALRYRAAGGEP
jgi:hypothetical protein